jgi:predicted exporter
LIYIKKGAITISFFINSDRYAIDLVLVMAGVSTDLFTIRALIFILGVSLNSSELFLNGTEEKAFASKIEL